MQWKSQYKLRNAPNCIALYSPAYSKHRNTGRRRRRTSTQAPPSILASSQGGLVLPHTTGNATNTITVIWVAIRPHLLHRSTVTSYVFQLGRWSRSKSKVERFTSESPARSKFQLDNHYDWVAPFRSYPGVLSSDHARCELELYKILTWYF